MNSAVSRVVFVTSVWGAGGGGRALGVPVRARAVLPRSERIKDLCLWLPLLPGLVLAGSPPAPPPEPGRAGPRRAERKRSLRGDVTSAGRGGDGGGSDGGGGGAG